MGCSTVNMFYSKPMTRNREPGSAMLEIGVPISTEPQNDFKAKASNFKPPALFFVKYTRKFEKLPVHQ
jgi:hypothetical protein